MAEFDDLRSKLADARTGMLHAQHALLGARQQLERLTRERQQRTRSQPQSADLDERIAQAQSDVERLKTKYRTAEQSERSHFEAFAQFSDPRENSSRLSDRTPVLLMPLRIETRFKSSQETGDRSDELWVRVYPDDISIDSFEKSLSQSEAQSTRSYWAEIWRASGDRTDERAAWRTLLSGQASGRSHWLIQTYRPLNEADRPMKAPGVPTVILAVTTLTPLVDPEKGHVSTYWEALWRAGEDVAAVDSAEAALVAQVGDARAAEIRTNYRPRNLSDLPPEGTSRAATNIVVAYLEFPPDAAVPVRESTWSQVPVATALPDRLVLLGFNDIALTLEQLGNPIPASLAVAPDPSADEANQLRPDGSDIKVGSELEWVVNFDRAVEVGMGFKVKLTTEQFRQGFDNLMVLGLRVITDADAGKAAFEQLIAHHHQSRSGFSLLPQGRPTNNVEGTDSAYSWQEDPDVSFDHYFPDPTAPPTEDSTDWFSKTDGRWLAELLGLEPAALGDVPFYGRRDLSEARSMNVALWPATLGYFMQSMLDPVFDEDTVEQTRDFFTRHVLARGQIPAIRVGKQPYGILPATARSRIEWLFKERRSPSPQTQFHRRLYKLLRKVEVDFEPMLNKVSYIGKAGDAHQILLDVVGLHANSVEFRQRYAESLDHLYNRLLMQGAGGAFVAVIIALGYVQSGLSLLGELGYANGENVPDIIEKLFIGSANPLKGGLIDDRPLSETAAIRAYTDDGANYIDWLIKAAGSSHDALRLQDGFKDLPTALLYLMLHHALDLSFVETSVRLFANAGLLGEEDLRAFRREPKFVQVRESAAGEPARERSRWHYLYRSDAEITGDPLRTVGEFIPTVLTSIEATAYLKHQIQALEQLRLCPTAVLERVFAEHLDLCSYRLDSWYGGLLSHQLETLRYAQDGDGEVQRKTGVHLGAYGWLEEVRPENKVLTPFDLPPELAALFDPSGDKPPLIDSTNQGYIHAPSLNQAVTAAVLRNGYLSNATPANPTSLAVNLSSERVRMALSIVEGTKAEQSITALLGYRFERGLHDRHDVEIDSFIYDLRKAFPLVGDRLTTTKTDMTDEFGEPVKISQVEARNVIDGLALVEHIRTTGKSVYPFGFDATVLPPADPGQAQALSEEAGRIVELADAVADLAMAESVHQVVQGNYDRAGAVLDTYSKGKFPATPGVIQTPRSGVMLTHRVALHLKTGLDPSDPALTSPRARAEPAINALLADLLPPADAVACTVDLEDPVDHSVESHTVHQSELDLLPIDLLYLLDPDDEGSARALDDLIEAHVIKTHTPKADAVLTIRYRERIAAIAGHVPFFELAALIRSLRSLLLRARPLRPTDMALAQESNKVVDLDEALAPARVLLVRDAITAPASALGTFGTALQAQLDAHAEAQIISEIDQRVQEFTQILLDLTPFAKLQTGTGALSGERRRIAASLRTVLEQLIKRWNNRLAQFDQAIVSYDAAPGASEAMKFEALLMAERLVSTTATDPLPPLPDDLRNALTSTARGAFVSQRDSLAALHQNATGLADLHAGIEASKTANAPFDSEPIDIAAQTRQIIALAENMARRAASLGTELSEKRVAVKAQLDAHDSAATAKARISALTAAAKLLLGEDFQIIPDFALPLAQSEEWAAAWGPGASADPALLNYLTANLGRRFPVDDWFAGTARVREKMHELETVTHLAGAFSSAEIPLQPLQFPHRPEVPWLGLDFPVTKPDGTPFVIDEDKLLYTAHYAAPFDKTKRLAGLLLDEWTELIPSRTEETGLAFHYDRPNSEPPQTLLLALPSDYTGGWRWQDLVDTVRETMDLAKKRAIEPDHIDTTAYARFLPAIISATTLHPITASLNFAFNNNLAAVLAAADGDTP